MISRFFGIFTGRVSARIGSGFLLLVILLIGCAGTGFYGMYRLGKILSFISGPAWSNADSIMNGVIKTQGQMLAVRKLLSGSDPVESKNRISQLGDEAREAFDEFIKQKLMTNETYSELATLQYDQWDE